MYKANETVVRDLSCYVEFCGSTITFTSTPEGTKIYPKCSLSLLMPRNEPYQLRERRLWELAKSETLSRPPYDFKMGCILFLNGSVSSSTGLAECGNKENMIKIPVLRSVHSRNAACVTQSFQHLRFCCSKSFKICQNRMNFRSAQASSGQDIINCGSVYAR